tara:strand:+ start:2249 stop:3262 length:1014 start_codon:yes stop_codon:yes gene_type:complete
MSSIKLSEIHFCNGTENHMVSNDEKQALVEKLVAKTAHTDIHYNPDTIKILTQENENKLLDGRLITPYVSGIPILLYLTHFKNKASTFLIDQRIRPGYKYPKIIVPNWSFPNYAYMDTLLIGKLGQHPRTQEWTLLLYDVLYMNNKEWSSSTNLVQRHITIHKLLDHFTPNASCLKSIQIVRLFNNKQIAKFYEYNKNSPLPISGVLFMHNIQKNDHLVLMRDLKKSRLLQQIIKQINQTNYKNKLEFVCECERTNKSNAIGKLFLFEMGTRTFLQDVVIEHLSLPKDIDLFRVLVRYNPNIEEFNIRELASQRSLTKWRGSLSAHLPPVWYDSDDD